jgi:hypothetical protein
VKSALDRKRTLVALLCWSGVAAAADSAPPGCPPGEKIQWIADYCMAKLQTDDEIAASDCISTEYKVAFSDACAGKLYFKRALCEIVVKRGTRAGTVDMCVADKTFAGNTVQNGGVGGKK